MVILADDMGYGDPACNNPASKIRTPAIDRLAAEGLRMTDAHSPGAVCVPTRYGLLTGRYPFRARLAWREQAVIEPQRLTIGKLLLAQGYQTACVGKWHLGFDGGPDYDYQNMRGGPVDQGFRSYFGIPASLDIPPYYYVRDRQAVAPPTGRVEANSSEGWSPIQGAFWREGGAAPGFSHTQVLPRLADESRQTIAQLAEDRRPFFLYLALPAPHTPWLPLAQYRGRSEAGMYGDFVLQVDDLVAGVLEQLEKSGVADNTLVVFTSDNGPVWYEADTQRLGHSSTGPLRGMKGDAWEGGHRVPFLVRWPAAVKPGGVSDRTICHTDLLATVAELVGAELPEGAGQDSVSLLPTLRGDSQPPRKSLAIVSSGGFATVRQGPWKLILGLGSGGFSQPRKVKPEDGAPAVQLYNLNDDLGETRNLAGEEAERVEQLRALWERISGKGA